MKSSPLACFLAGAVAATALTAAAAPKKQPKRFEKLDVFARVLSYVENNYVENIDEKKLIYGAAKGMVRTLDPHSAFLTPEEFADLRADTDGEFGGLGIQLDDRDDELVVLEVLTDTPAQRAGLAAGDRIISIDGTPMRELAPEEATSRLRGKPGTSVTIEVVRKGWDAPRPFSITREIIRVKAVEAMTLSPGVGYLRIKQFQERTDEEVVAALEAFKKEFGQIDALVLDLRGNPGGLLDQSVRIADLFIESGIIVTTRGRGGKTLEEDVARAAGTYTGFPIVCLMNGGSASASEIVAGALQDHGRALILGTRSFGKGSVQSIIPLEDGSGLKLTVARYYTPSGRSIQEKGIVPDVMVEQLDADKLEDARLDEDVQREEDLDGHLRNDAGAGAAGRGSKKKKTPKAATPGTPGEKLLATDYQVQVAVQTLQSWRKYKGQ